MIRLQSKYSFHHVQLSTISSIIITWAIMILLVWFISVHFSIIIKDITIKGIKISQSITICFLLICTFSTTPYGDTTIINTRPCSLLIGSSWPGTVPLISWYVCANWSLPVLLSSEIFLSHMSPHIYHFSTSLSHYYSVSLGFYLSRHPSKFMLFWLK